MSPLARALMADLHAAALDNPALRRRLGRTPRHPLSIPEAQRLLFLSTQRECLDAYTAFWTMDSTLRDMHSAIRNLNGMLRDLRVDMTVPEATIDEINEILEEAATITVPPALIERLDRELAEDE